MSKKADKQQRVVLVTGDSSGIGRACCERFVASGRVVFGASRSKPDAAAWTHLSMDITDDPSVLTAVNEVLAREERIDAVVHCAGASFIGPFEDTSPAEAVQHFEVNYFGAVRVLRSALPAMRRQQSGKLIVVGSIGGLIGLRYLSHYCAGKAALDRLIEALRPEVARYGIEATIVHPGDFNTNLRTNCSTSAATKLGSSYYGEFERYAEFYHQCEAQGRQPDALAARIDSLLERRRLPAKVVAGTRLETLGAIGKRLLPARLFERIAGIIHSP